MPTSEQIAAQQELYLSYLPLVRREYGYWPGVALIGLGAKERQGEVTEEWAFRFYVREKKPLNEIPVHERIPAELYGIQTDIIPQFETDLLVCDSAARVNDLGEYRDAGILGGAPIRNEFFGNDHASGYGTLGILARRVGDNKLVGLTCAHVVNSAADTMTSLGTKIGQPQYWVSCCCCPRGRIGTVSNAVHNDHLDCAIIEIDDDIRDKVAAATGENKILAHAGTTPPAEIKTISGARAIMCFETVTKRGQGTGLTTGRVVDLAYGTNQMLIQSTSSDPNASFACHGDSGAVLVSNNNMVLGLVVAAARGNMKRTIATHIKPVMQALNISIAGVQFGTLSEPVDGGPDGCEIKAWPGGQADTALNPVETFDSTMFGFAGPIRWDITAGAPGASIVDFDGTMTAATVVNSATTIKVRYNTVSSSIDTTNAVQVKATSGGSSKIKFRTIFKITPRAINTSAALDTDNTKRFLATGGNNALSGVDYPATGGITRYLAKAEIAYDILPTGIDWAASGGISFVTGNPAGTKGNILSKRETKFCRGQQATGAPNRTHTDQAGWVTAGDSSADDFQGASAASRNKIFRLANKGFLPQHEGNDINHDSFNPTTYIQRYVRSHYRDSLSFHDGNAWVRITPQVEWSVNLTAVRNGAGTAPPTPGAAGDNIVVAGLNAATIPNTRPVIAAIATQEVNIGGEATVTLTALPTDEDRDELAVVTWTQTSPAPVVALTANPALPRTSVRFATPATNRQLKFTVTVSDGTLGLSRSAGNHTSTPIVATVNVVEWLHRDGGLGVVANNETEVITSAQMGMSGNVNWRVDTGTADGFIVETGGATANSRNSITVRYDQASADLTRATTVVIQATAPDGTVFFKRRTVRVIEWLQRCGARPVPADNGTEVFNSADFGLAGAVNWDVSTGVPDGFIVETGTTTANGRASITVRYDNHSPDATRANTLIVKAIDPANPLIFNYKRRSVARVVMTLRASNHAEPAPEFEDYANVLFATGGLDDLGPLPMGAGRSDYPNDSYTAPILVVGEITGHLPTTVFRWVRMLTRRSWFIQLNAAGTQWDVTQRNKRGPVDDSDAGDYNDSTPSAAHNRIYMYDNSALVLSAAHVPATALVPVGGYVYEEKAFTYRVDRQDGAAWVNCAQIPVGQIIKARRDNNTGTVTSDWVGLENSHAIIQLSATVTEAEVRAIVGGVIPIVIDPGANL